jgi:hypothetical protein
MTNAGPSFQIARVSMLISAIALVSSCGGGGGGSTALPTSGSSNSSTALGPMSVGFSIVNSVPTSDGKRSPQSVSSSIKGLAVFAYPAGTTQPSTPTMVGDLTGPPLCQVGNSGRTCNITFNASVGQDAVVMQFYDQVPSGGTITGNIICTGSGPITVSANGTNSATITLNCSAPFSVGSTAMLAATPTTSITSGSVSFALPSGTGGAVAATVSEVLQVLLPLSTQRRPQFVQGAGNTSVWAFGLNLTPSTTILPSPGVSLINTAFVLTGSLASTFAAAPSGTLNAAVYTGTGYTDVGYMTYSYTASSNTLVITSNMFLLSGETGVNQSGIYVVYMPPAAQIVPTPPAANSLSVAFTPPTGTISGVTYNGTSYYPVIGANDPNLSYLVKSAAAPVQITITAFDSNGKQIKGNLTTPITITSSDTTGSFTSLTPTTISTPANVMIQFTGSTLKGSSNTTTIGTSTPGIKVNESPSATISAGCIRTNSPYEGGNNSDATDVGIDVGEDAAGCG